MKKKPENTGRRAPVHAMQKIGRDVEKKNRKESWAEMLMIYWRTGGEVQLRSIWSKARVHSATQAMASFSTPAAVGVRPPHMAGLAAKVRACLAIRPLLKKKEEKQERNVREKDKGRKKM